LKRLKLITLIIASVLMIVFVLQNTESVTVQFLLYSLSVPALALFLVLLLAGFVAGVIVGQRIRSRSTKN